MDACGESYIYIDEYLWTPTLMTARYLHDPVCLVTVHSNPVPIIGSSSVSWPAAKGVESTKDSNVIKSKVKVTGHLASSLCPGQRQ